MPVCAVLFLLGKAWFHLLSLSLSLSPFLSLTHAHAHTQFQRKGRCNTSVQASILWFGPFPDWSSPLGSESNSKSVFFNHLTDNSCICWTLTWISHFYRRGQMLRSDSYISWHVPESPRCRLNNRFCNSETSNWVDLPVAATHSLCRTGLFLCHKGNKDANWLQVTET